MKKEEGEGDKKCEAKTSRERRETATAEEGTRKTEETIHTPSSSYILFSLITYDEDIQLAHFD